MQALAAKQWANRENISPYSTDTVGVLNEIAGLGLDKKNWLDFNGICNYIAGTSGLPAAAALRQIYPTTDLLTGVASYYIDATDASASGQTVTNLGNAGSLLPTTLGSTTSADSNDPIFLAHTGTNYVYHPGANSNTQSIPDSAALDITGDIDLRAFIALDDWTPAGNGAIIDKRDSSASGISYTLRINTAGTLGLSWTADGTTAITANSTVATGVTDGTAKWIRATLDVNNGAGGYEVNFFLSDNGTTWTQLGTTITGASTTSIYSGSGNVALGGSLLGAFFITGKYYRAQIFSDITETTKVLDVDTSVITTGAATSFTAVTGQTVTINRTNSGRKTVAVTQPTWLFGTDDYMEVNNRYIDYSGSNYLYLPGVSLNAATTPDAAALDITGDIDIRCKVALDDWTPGALGVLISKYGAAGNRSYQFYVNTTGTLEIAWTADGSTALTSTSTVAPTVVDGATLWVRATLDVDNDAVGNTTTFFTSNDGTTWTQLGSTVVKAGITSIYSGTTQLAVGANSQSSLTQTSRGKFFRAQVLNGIDGTVVFDANFESSITSLLQTTFTESSANAATVTINRSGTAFQSAGITQAGYLYAGATNTFTASATDFLNFGASDSFTLVAVMREWATPISASGPLSKRAQSATFPGWYLRHSDTNFTLQAAVTDTDIQSATVSTPTYSAGALLVASAVLNRNNNTLIAYSGATASSSVSTSSIDSITSATDLTLRIGLTNTGTAVYLNAEIFSLAVFRTVLTATQIRQITNYFANREAYL